MSMAFDGKTTRVSVIDAALSVYTIAPNSWPSKRHVCSYASHLRRLIPLLGPRVASVQAFPRWVQVDGAGSISINLNSIKGTGRIRSDVTSVLLDSSEIDTGISSINGSTWQIRMGVGKNATPWTHIERGAASETAAYGIRRGGVNAWQETLTYP